VKGEGIRERVNPGWRIPLICGLQIKRKNETRIWRLQLIILVGGPSSHLGEEKGLTTGQGEKETGISVRRQIDSLDITIEKKIKGTRPAAIPVTLEKNLKTLPS